MTSNTGYRAFTIVSVVFPIACNALLGNDERHVAHSAPEGGTSGWSNDGASMTAGGAGLNLDSAGSGGVSIGSDGGMSGSNSAGEAGSDGGMSGSSSAGAGKAGAGGEAGSSCTACTRGETKAVTRSCACGKGTQSGTETCSETCKKVTAWPGACIVSGSDRGCSFVNTCPNDNRTECIQSGCTQMAALAECLTEVKNVCGEEVREPFEMTYCSP